MNTVIPSEVEESRCITLTVTLRRPLDSASLRSE